MINPSAAAFSAGTAVRAGAGVAARLAIVGALRLTEIPPSTGDDQRRLQRTPVDTRLTTRYDLGDKHGPHTHCRIKFLCAIIHLPFRGITMK